MNQAQFEALPEKQRIAAQERLISLGLYNGRADGKFGAGTKAAFELEEKQKRETADKDRASEEKKRADDLKLKELEIRSKETEQKGSVIEADNAKKASDLAREQRYGQQSSSALGLATQSAANLAAPAAGTAGGMVMGRGVNMLMDASQARKNDVLKGIADDRLSALTTREGAREGARLAGAVPLSNPLLRSAARAVPHVGLGAISMGKGAQVLSENNPDDEFYTQMANRGAGLGYLGVGAGLMKQGLRYSSSPGVPPDGRSLAIINSNQLRRNALMPGESRPLTAQTIDLTAEPAPRVLPAPASEPSKGAAPGTKAYLLQQAKSLEIKGATRLSKPDLAQAVATKLSEHGGKRTVAKRGPKVSGAFGPALAAGMAYAATPDEAMAADGSASGGAGEAMTNAGIAGGTAYGVQKGVEAMSPMVGRAIGAAGSMLAPSNIDAMSSPTSDEMATAANWQIENLPSWALSPNVRQTAEMGQVPEPSPMRQQEVAEPEDFESQMQELQSLLAGLDAPQQQAAASQRVVSMPQQQQFQPQMQMQRNALLR